MLEPTAAQSTSVCVHVARNNKRHMDAGVSRVLHRCGTVQSVTWAKLDMPSTNQLKSQCTKVEVLGAGGRSSGRGCRRGSGSHVHRQRYGWTARTAPCEQNQVAESADIIDEETKITDRDSTDKLDLNLIATTERPIASVLTHVTESHCNNKDH